MNYRELTRQPRRLGYEFYRQAAGSHEIWWNPSTGQRITIPNHGSRDIPKGTMVKILRDLGVDLDELRRA
ncbi:MAG: type II toxin-antitoxin system HicA family toxin [Anaerolineae bacterium]|jgi:predicted RNA binding protein YcfA (HicA-like mRNA interferase family)|nr:type II toxin-antitoxin system HicA family toxin [Anaerolineae bacterium]MDH7472913.1 type II toxin-antitoxin system HicA family toxin [Anaerolineae bacterium]